MTIPLSDFTLCVCGHPKSKHREYDGYLACCIEDCGCGANGANDRPSAGFTPSAPEQPAKAATRCSLSWKHQPHDYCDGNPDAPPPFSILSPPAAGTQGKTRGETWAENNVAMDLDGDLSVCGYCTADRVRDELSAAIDAAAAEARGEGVAEGAAQERTNRSLSFEAMHIQYRDACAALAKARSIIAQHNLCHDLHGKVGAREFADGCAAEQRKLYGCAPDADEVARLNTALADARQAAEMNANERNELAAALAAARKPGNAGEAEQITAALFDDWDTITFCRPGREHVMNRAEFAAHLRYVLPAPPAPAPGETAEAYARRIADEVYPDGNAISWSRSSFMGRIKSAFTAGSISRPAAAKPDAEGLAEKIVDGLHDAKLAVYSSSFDVTREYLIATIRSILAVPERKGP